jgi:hypothetical protein
MRHRLRAPFIALCVASALPAGATELRLEEAGIYCVSPKTGGSEPAPNTVSGVVNFIEGRPFDLPGRVVPTRLGLGFGIRVRLEEDGDLPVRMHMRHPPLGSDGATESWYESVVRGGEIHTRSFTFDEPWEMVPGTWTMEIRRGDDVLLAVEFAVTDAPVPAVDAVCSTLLS